MRVFPVLKPASWQGLTYGARAHVWIGTPQAPEVVVAYGCYDGGFASYITNETPAYNDLDVLVREAGGKPARWKNLEKIWPLLQDKKEFYKYVQDETRAMLAPGT